MNAISDIILLTYITLHYILGQQKNGCNKLSKRLICSNRRALACGTVSGIQALSFN